MQNDNRETHVQEIESTRDNGLFLVDEFLYVVEKKVNSRCYCRCLRAKTEYCEARAIIDRVSRIFRLISMLCVAVGVRWFKRQLTNSCFKVPELRLTKRSRAHCHENERLEIMRRNAITRMKEEVILRADKSCQEVYREVLAEIADQYGTECTAEDIGSALPTFENVRTALQRHRASVRPSLPRSLAEVVLEGPWTMTKSGENFLVINDGAENRMLGFCDRAAMKILCQAPTIYLDGTFKVVPSIFCQLYSLHAFYKNQMMPLCFFLLPNKEKETYKRMFRLMINYAESLGLQFSPSKMQLDFEVSALKAIKECFPRTVLKGCAFHYTQAIYRSVQRNGLAAFYHEDAVVKR